MNRPDDASDQQLDDFDFAILDGIRAIFEQIDPMPADLPERVRFSLALRGLETEVARLVTEEDPRLAGARGTEQSRTVTFDSDSLSIVIRIAGNKSGSVRIDGWLAPPQRREIEMQTSAETLSVSSDGAILCLTGPDGAWLVETSMWDCEPIHIGMLRHALSAKFVHGTQNLIVLYSEGVIRVYNDVLSC